MGKLNTHQSMMLWESIGILPYNVKEFDMLPMLSETKLCIPKAVQRTPTMYLQLDAELYSHSKEMFLFPQSLTSE